jgi:hypothetical protein
MKTKIFLLAVISLMAVEHSTAQIVKKGLVGYWPFNGNANDESVNNNHGSVTGATLTKDRFGISNSAYKFDGNADYIDCGDSANLRISTNTTNFWFIYSDTTKTQNFVNITNSESGEWGANYYSHATAGLVVGLSGGANDSWIAAITKKNQRYADSTWHMFTSAYSAKDNSLSFYIDGGFISNITDQNKGFIKGKDSLVHNGKERWVFGVRSQYITAGTSAPGYLNGYLDDVMLFNRVLTPTEISLIYNETVGWETVNIKQGEDIVAYPNPTDNTLLINSKTTPLNGCQVKVKNNFGQLVHTTTIQNSTLTIDLDMYATNGVYIVEIVDSKGDILKRQKVILY